MATYVKINDHEYPAEIFGRMQDYDWGNRESKTIHLTMDYETAASLFVSGAKWSILMDVTKTVQRMNEDGSPALTEPDEHGIQYPIYDTVTEKEEYNNDEFNIAGSITDNRDGTVDCKMGKPTDLENAYEMMFGGM